MQFVKGWGGGWVRWGKRGGGLRELTHVERYDIFYFNFLQRFDIDKEII